MKIAADELRRIKSLFSALEEERQPFLPLWRDLADFYLPKRYVWLNSGGSARVRTAKNPNILDSTGTTAARILAGGMMNGITSPGRPWFSLRIPGFADDPNDEAKIWCDEVTRRMLLIMAESNLYNSLAVLYLDLCVFGTAAALIYEDDESVFRCYNPALGEYHLGQSFRLSVDTFSREFTQTVGQVVRRWGEANVSDSVRNAYRAGRTTQSVRIRHLIEPNDPPASDLPKHFKYRETYWESGSSADAVLSRAGYNEMPGIFPRWEITANDSYGTSPAMDALGDVIQLQLETRRKAQGLDKMVRPPIIADIQLQHKPTALVPDGITYVAGANNIGAKPIYTVALPIAEITADLQAIQARIREVFHNPLFNMISQLDTVRSATEIDARREEKLVLLGPVLERFENEALDPAIRRIFSIMQRQRLLPEPPESIQNLPIEIQYVSILSTAQRAVAAIPTERLVGLVGQIAAVEPSALRVPNWTELIRNYADSIGVQAKDLNSREAVARNEAAEQQQLAAQEAAVVGQTLVEGAQTLSETDVGGGANALQRILGG